MNNFITFIRLLFLPFHLIGYVAGLIDDKLEDIQFGISYKKFKKEHE